MEKGAGRSRSFIRFDSCAMMTLGVGIIGQESSISAQELSLSVHCPL